MERLKEYYFKNLQIKYLNSLGFKIKPDDNKKKIKKNKKKINTKL